MYSPPPDPIGLTGATIPFTSGNLKGSDTLTATRMTVYSPGSTYTGFKFTVAVEVHAPNATFVNCLFEASTTDSLVKVLPGVNKSATFINCKISPATPRAGLDCVKGSNITLDHCEISKGVDGVSIYGTTTYEDPFAGNVHIIDSWIHDMSWFSTDPNYSDGTHNDGCQSVGGGNVTVSNTKFTGTMKTSSFMIDSIRNRIDGFLIQDCWFEPTDSSVVINVVATAVVKNLRIINNGFKGTLNGTVPGIRVPTTIRTDPTTTISGNIYMAQIPDPPPDPENPPDPPPGLPPVVVEETPPDLATDTMDEFSGATIPQYGSGPYGDWMESTRPLVPVVLPEKFTEFFGVDARAVLITISPNFTNFIINPALRVDSSGWRKDGEVIPINTLVTEDSWVGQSIQATGACEVTFADKDVNGNSAHVYVGITERLQKTISEGEWYSDMTRMSAEWTFSLYAKGSGRVRLVMEAYNSVDPSVEKSPPEADPFATISSQAVTINPAMGWFRLNVKTYNQTSSTEALSFLGCSWIKIKAVVEAADDLLLSAFMLDPHEWPEAEYFDGSMTEDPNVDDYMWGEVDEYGSVQANKSISWYFLNRRVRARWLKENLKYLVPAGRPYQLYFGDYRFPFTTSAVPAPSALETDVFIL